MCAMGLRGGLCNVLELKGSACNAPRAAAHGRWRIACQRDGSVQAKSLCDGGGSLLGACQEAGAAADLLLMGLPLSSLRSSLH